MMHLIILAIFCYELSRTLETQLFEEVDVNWRFVELWGWDQFAAAPEIDLVDDVVGQVNFLYLNLAFLPWADEALAWLVHEEDAPAFWLVVDPRSVKDVAIYPVVLSHSMLIAIFVLPDVDIALIVERSSVHVQFVINPNAFTNRHTFFILSMIT